MNIKRSAFTLIELLSVIAVIGVLAAILIPVVGKVRKSSYDATCTSNLRQMSAAYLLMIADNKNILIPAIEAGENNTHLTSKWYKQLEEGGNARAWNIPLASFMPGSNLQDFKCPEVLAALGPFSDKRKSRSSYGFNHYVGINGKGAVRMEQLFSPSETIMFGDTQQEGAGAVTQQFLAPGTIHAWHGDSAKISYFDGSVSSITVEEAQAKPPNSDEGYLFWRGIERR